MAYSNSFCALINEFNDVLNPFTFFTKDLLKNALAVRARCNQLVRPCGPEFPQPLTGRLFGHVGEIVTQGSGSAAEGISPVSLHFYEFYAIQ